MNAPRTQHERLADFLMAHRQGLTAIDCVRRPTFDGGAPIMRPSSRMQQVRGILDAKGYDLVTEGRRHRCVIYKARRRTATRELASVIPAAEALFEPPPAAPRSPLDPWDGDQ